MDHALVRNALASAGAKPDTIEPMWPVPDSPLVAAVAADKALIVLAATRLALIPVGCVPVLLGGGDAVAALRKNPCYEPAEPAAQILARSMAVDGAAFLSERLNEQDEAGGIPRGEWPLDVLPSSDLVAHLDVLKRTPRSRVYLAASPSPEPWAAPALLRLGGWNDCPCPEEHAAVHRRWQAAYGAAVVSVTQDVVECTVSIPPVTHDAAVALALEQYAYAPDIVDQGTQSIEALAAALLGGTTWFFWWD